MLITMRKPKQYPLNEYIKAAERLAAQKGFRLEVGMGSKNAIRFDVFMAGETQPWDFWTVHTNHNKRREVWSKEDYRKPDRCMGLGEGTFLAMLESL